VSRKDDVINKSILIVVMPAYNAELTLLRTFDELPFDIVDHVVLVDDSSRDGTAALARELGIDTIVHPQNIGYGGNQKTCYHRAMDLDADIVVMLHPDYQYTPKLIRSMASMISEDVADVVLGSRILGNGAIAGGMPRYKYYSNRFLTAAQNLMIRQKLSEYHTGYRAFSRRVLETVRFDGCSDDFVFDNQMLVQCHAAGFRIGEVSCPTHYFDDSSSLGVRRSITYGVGCLAVSCRYFAHRVGLRSDPMFACNEVANPVPGALES
jgi:glycosyltransferase involved in cell wall biosynthesis